MTTKLPREIGYTRGLMFKNYPIINTITSFILPYIFLYTLYIQLNGESSPGGGFQAGVIFASSLIAYELIYGKNFFKELLSINLLIIASALGVMIYTFTGLISLIFNDNYLNYSSLAADAHFAQELGIFTVEVGIGITVSAVMCLIYLMFQDQSEL